jgi:Platelet-activating factor acetylhydrolase, isoform II
MFSGKLMQSIFLKIISITMLAIIIVLAVSIVPKLQLPKPTGKYDVGQTVFRWLDSSRPEVLTDDPDDSREVIAAIWYPAEPGTGAIAPYFAGLSTVSIALIESGEVAQWEVMGLRFIRSRNLSNAKLANNESSYSVVILSPGNGTNIQFYTILASEIASHGCVVVGLNHPYDVAAVELSNGEVALYDKDQWSLEPSAHQAYISERIKVRTADTLFALDQLEVLNSSTDNPFAGRLDLASVAVGGHSLGGITASEACKADSRFRTCFNFDGLQVGGPFSLEPTAIPPVQPFMFLTKEAQLHPKLIESFESTRESYWVVIHGASHQSFTDGPVIQPSIILGRNEADEIMGLIQEYAVAFLDQTLKGEPADLLAKSVNQQNVSVEVFPSN